MNLNTGYHEFNLTERVLLPSKFLLCHRCPFLVPRYYTTISLSSDMDNKGHCLQKFSMKRYRKYLRRKGELRAEKYLVFFHKKCGVDIYILRQDMKREL